MTQMLDPEAIRSMLKITHRQFIDRISKRPDFPRTCLVLSQKNKRWNAADIQSWQEKKAKELSR